MSGLRFVPHNTLPMSDATAKRLAELNEAIDRELQSDRQFFAHRADRTHRVRRSFPAEAESALRCMGKFPLPGHLRLYTAVRQIKPGVRVRVYFSGPPGLDTDLPDIAAKSVFDNSTTSTIPDAIADSLARHNRRGS